MLDILNKGVIYGAATMSRNARAAKLLDDVDLVKTSLAENRWVLAELMQEIMDNHYHVERGFTDFDTYVDQSNFDVGSREIRYYLRINRVSKQLGITRDELKAVNVSKLKEIFSLDPVKQGDDIVRLVSDAVTMSLEEVRQSVRQLKGSDPETDMAWLNVHVLRRAKEETILPALQKVKLEYGPTMSDVPGQSAEISDGRALEMLCADKLAAPDEELMRLQDAVDAEGPEEA